MWDWSSSKNRGPGRARPARRRQPLRSPNDEGYPDSLGTSQQQPYQPSENRTQDTRRQPRPQQPARRDPARQQPPYPPQENRQPAPSFHRPPSVDAGQQYSGGANANYEEDNYHYVDDRRPPSGFSSIGRGGVYEEPVPSDYDNWQPPTMSNDASMWQAQFEQMNFQGMTLKECQFIFLDPDTRNELRSAFKRSRRDFLKFVGYNHSSELTAAGVSEEGIKIIRRGRSPENYNVHMKVPVDYSGSNDFSNLILIQTHPYHDEIHKFLDMQIAQHPVSSRIKRLYIPIPTGKIYIPSGGFLASGGKDKEDKSIHAGFLTKHFTELTIKKRMTLGGD